MARRRSRHLHRRHLLYSPACLSSAHPSLFHSDAIWMRSSSAAAAVRWNRVWRCVLSVCLLRSTRRDSIQVDSKQRKGKRKKRGEKEEKDQTEKTRRQAIMTKRRKGVYERTCVIQVEPIFYELSSFLLVFRNLNLHLFKQLRPSPLYK